MLPTEQVNVAEWYLERVGHDHTYDLEKEKITVGRIETDLIFPDTRVSRRHCEIYVINNQWNVRDLDSMNGVIINGHKMTKGGFAPLNENDQIGFGAVNPMVGHIYCLRRREIKPSVSSLAVFENVDKTQIIPKKEPTETEPVASTSSGPRPVSSSHSEIVILDSDDDFEEKRPQVELKLRKLATKPGTFKRRNSEEDFFDSYKEDIPAPPKKHRRIIISDSESGDENLKSAAPQQNTKLRAVPDPVEVFKKYDIKNCSVRIARMTAKDIKKAIERLKPRSGSGMRTSSSRKKRSSYLDPQDSCQTSEGLQSNHQNLNSAVDQSKDPVLTSPSVQSAPDGNLASAAARIKTVIPTLLVKPQPRGPNPQDCSSELQDPSSLELLPEQIEPRLRGASVYSQVEDPDEDFPMSVLNPSPHSQSDEESDDDIFILGENLVDLPDLGKVKEEPLDVSDDDEVLLGWMEILSQDVSFDIKEEKKDSQLESFSNMVTSHGAETLPLQVAAADPPADTVASAGRAPSPLVVLSSPSSVAADGHPPSFPAAVTSPPCLGSAVNPLPCSAGVREHPSETSALAAEANAESETSCTSPHVKMEQQEEDEEQQQWWPDLSQAFYDETESVQQRSALAQPSRTSKHQAHQTKPTEALPLSHSSLHRRLTTAGGAAAPPRKDPVAPKRRTSTESRTSAAKGKKNTSMREKLKKDHGLTGYTASVKAGAGITSELAVLTTKPGTSTAQRGSATAQRGHIEASKATAAKSGKTKQSASTTAAAAVDGTAALLPPPAAVKAKVTKKNRSSFLTDMAPPLPGEKKKQQQRTNVTPKFKIPKKPASKPETTEVTPEALPQSSATAAKAASRPTAPAGLLPTPVSAATASHLSTFHLSVPVATLSKTLAEAACRPTAPHSSTSAGLPSKLLTTSVAYRPAVSYPSIPAGSAPKQVSAAATYRPSFFRLSPFGGSDLKPATTLTASLLPTPHPSSPTGLFPRPSTSTATASLLATPHPVPSEVSIGRSVLRIAATCLPDKRIASATPILKMSPENVAGPIGYSRRPSGDSRIQSTAPQQLSSTAVVSFRARQQPEAQRQDSSERLRTVRFADQHEERRIPSVVSEARAAGLATPRPYPRDRPRNARPVLDPKLHNMWTKDSLLLRIFFWNPTWLDEQKKASDPPPLLQGKKDLILASKIMPVLNCYGTCTAYVNIFMPLVLHELWEEMTRQHEANPKHLQLQIREIIGSGHFRILRCVAAKPPEYRIFQRDLIQVDLDDSRESSSSVFAFVENVSGERTNHLEFRMLQNSREQSYVTLTLKTRVKDFREGSMLNARQIGNANNTLRHLRAMRRDLVDSSLKDLILQPSLDDFKMKNLQQLDQRQLAPEVAMGTPLNNSQLQAILSISDAVLSQPEEPKICLLQGPPGTGKSHTIVALVLQLLYKSCANDEKPKILICAPSNAAIDEIVYRLKVAFNENPRHRKFSMVRIGVPESISSSVRQYSLQYITDTYMRQSSLTASSQSCQVSDEVAALLAEEKDLNRKCDELKKTSTKLLAANRVDEAKVKQRQLEEIRRQRQRVVDALNAMQRSPTSTAENGEEIKKVRFSILKNANIIASTLGSSYNTVMERHFSEEKTNFLCCIVDEASQCTEPESLVPLAFKINKLVLIGDPEQLPATVQSQVAEKNGFNRSLFSRLYSHLQLSSPDMEFPGLMLDTQYRMHYDICAWPSKYFYGNRLQTPSSLHRGSALRPYRVLSVLDGEEQISGKDIYNPVEAHLIASLVSALKNYDPVRNKSIGVISFYRKQRQLIEAGIRERCAAAARSVQVNTVDGFQGQEKDIIILSCVRTDESNVGFVAHSQRLNVALTRAKCSLIIFGNVTALSKYDGWKELLQDAYSRNVVSVVTSAFVAEKLLQLVTLNPTTISP